MHKATPLNKLSGFGASPELAGLPSAFVGYPELTGAVEFCPQVFKAPQNGGKHPRVSKAHLSFPEPSGALRTLVTRRLRSLR
eukprot:6084503-Alexandrium_andersonii.AAC.1